MLASGSSGNCTLIATGRTRVLIDAGVSCRQICERLKTDAAGEDASHIDAVLVSHEHCDHVAGLPVLAKKLSEARKRAGKGPLPVYLTAKAAPCIPWNGYDAHVEKFQAGSRITVGDIEVDTFGIPHDAIDPIGFRLRAEGVQVGVVTDLGYVPESVKYHLRGSHVLVLESNHDLDMLKVGPYPWSVKQRVMSRTGHLSNLAAAEFIRYDMDSSVDTLVLAHISENNNYPALVEISARQALAHRNCGARLAIAGHGEPTGPFLY